MRAVAFIVRNDSAVHIGRFTDVKRIIGAAHDIEEPHVTTMPSSNLEWKWTERKRPFASLRSAQGILAEWLAGPSTRFSIGAFPLLNGQRALRLASLAQGILPVSGSP